MLDVLRIRDYRLILAGQLPSNTGDWLLLVAAPFFVFELTGSTTATGLRRAGAAAIAVPGRPTRGTRSFGRNADLRILLGVAGLFFTGDAILTALLVPYLGGVLNAGAQSLGVLFGTLGLGLVLGGPALPDAPGSSHAPRHDRRIRPR
jgi:hypothetical protein